MGSVARQEREGGGMARRPVREKMEVEGKDRDASSLSVLSPPLGLQPIGTRAFSLAGPAAWAASLGLWPLVPIPGSSYASLQPTSCPPSGVEPGIDVHRAQAGSESETRASTGEVGSRRPCRRTCRTREGSLAGASAATRNVAPDEPHLSSGRASRLSWAEVDLPGPTLLLGVIVRWCAHTRPAARTPNSA